MKKNKTKILILIAIFYALSVYSFSSASEITGGLSNQGVIPIAPFGVSAVKTGDREITLSWNAVDGVDGYKIYRKKDSGSFDLVATLTDLVLTYKDQNLSDGVYSYQVQSFKGTLAPSLTNIQPTSPITISSATPTPTPASAGGGGGGGGGGFVPTPTPSPSSLSEEAKKVDINNDNKIDILDFNVIMVNWGAEGNNIADLNKDGKVDILDFNALMVFWS